MAFIDAPDSSAATGAGDIPGRIDIAVGRGSRCEIGLRLHVARAHAPDCSGYIGGTADSAEAGVDRFIVERIARDYRGIVNSSHQAAYAGYAAHAARRVTVADVAV